MGAWAIGWVLLVPLLVWLFSERTKWQTRCKSRERELLEAAEYKRELKELQEELLLIKVREREIETALREQQRAHEEKVKLIEQTKEKLSDSFKAISYEAIEKLRKSSDEESKKKEESFVKLMNPIKEGLGKLEEGMRLIEKERKGEQQAFKKHIEQIVESEQHLKNETANLVKALRKPEVRGMWGEIQLKRVVEISGMLDHCDFFEQNTHSEEGKIQRPDLIIRMPGGRQVIVDAKAPFEAFLEANHEDDPDRKEQRLKTHAKHIRQHIVQLGRKSYWEHFQPTPEFVVLFLPAEIFFSAALQFEPTLIEEGAKHNVILATPTTLIALLRAVAYGWKQDRFSQSAKYISQLGHELHKRLHDMTKHWAALGKSLSQAVEGYNKAIGSYESRVLATARKFQELGAASEELQLEKPDDIEKIPRLLSASLVESEE